MAYNKKKKSKDSTKAEAQASALVEVWRARIKSFEKKADKFLREGKDAYSEFLGNRVDDHDVRDRGDRAYAHVCRYIQSSYYSRKPEVIGSGDFDRNDTDAILAAYLAERLGKRFVHCAWFSEAIKGGRNDYIHTSRGITRVYLETEWVEVPKRIPVVSQEIQGEPFLNAEGMAEQPEPQTVYLMPNGKQVSAKADIMQDEEGLYINEGTKELKSACPYLGHVSFQDYYHTPEARSRDMLTWEAYKLHCTKADIKERWPDNYEDICDMKASDKEEKGKDYFDIFECWDKTTEKVVFLYLGGPGIVLQEIEDDPYGLDGFLPSVGPIVSSKLTDRMWGVSDYTNYKDKLDYLKSLDRRRKYLSTLLRRNAVGDGKHKDVLQNLNEAQRDGDVIFVDNYRDLVNDSKDGDGLVKFFPVEQYIEAFAEVGSAYAETKQEYYEYFGLDKLLMAEAPDDSREGEQAMASTLGLLYISNIRDFQDYVQENVRVLINLAVKRLPTDVFKTLVGYDFLPQEKKDRFEKAYEILSSNFNRAVRIDIDTDSTVATSQDKEVAANMQLFQTINQSLGPLTDIAQTKPEFAGPLAGIVLAAIEKMQGGKASSDQLTAAFSQFIDSAMNPPPPAAKPPDPAQQKVEIQGMLAEHKINIENREQEFKEFIESQRAALEKQKAAVDAQEKMLEEKRLADKQIMEMQSKLMEMQAKLKEAEISAKAQAITGMSQAQNREGEGKQEGVAEAIAAMGKLFVDILSAQRGIA